MSTESPRGVLVTVVLAGLAALLAWRPPAAAHDELLSSDPSESGVLETLPSRAVLTFSGAVAEVHEITVTGPDGSVANGDATSVGAEVRQNLWAGPDGAYILTYDVLSSDDHEIAGEIHFEVGEGVPAAGDEEAAARASSSSDTTQDGVLRGVVVPAAVVLLSGAGALALRDRRRTV